VTAQSVNQRNRIDQQQLRDVIVVRTAQDAGQELLLCYAHGVKAHFMRKKPTAVWREASVFATGGNPVHMS